MRKLNTAIAVALFAAGCSIVSVAAASGTENCRDLKARLTFPNPDGEANCELDGTVYGLCIPGSSKGNLKGMYTAYYQFDWFVPLAPLGVPEPDGANSNYNRNVTVVDTHRGSLIGDSQFVFDLRIFASGGGFVNPTIVTNGTGIYEGARGWFAAVFTDETFMKARLQGRVCGPNIPGGDDDDDDDDD